MDLYDEADKLRDRADQLERKARLIEDLDDLLMDFEDVVLMIRKSYDGKQQYTFAAVRYETGGFWRWAVTGRGDNTARTTQDMVELITDSKTTEVWIATEFESLFPQ